MVITLIKKALDLPASEYEELSSGEVINRITNDTNTLSSSFSNILKMFFISRIISCNF
ncbi:MAG: hypothetical protein L6V78_00100 [Clostridium sp.]|nr:MAG: hypothetical protein L6V78_00100 [Clostridium sp.]